MKQPPVPVATERKYIVPAVERAIFIMELLGQQPDGLTISQVAQQLTIPKSTAFTILNTLGSYRLVDRDSETGKYNLGIELFRLGSAVVEDLDVRAVAHPILRRLSEEVDLTTNLGVMDHDQVIYIDKIEGQGPIKVSSRIGGRMGLHCTALGKAMLAHQPEQRVLALLDHMPLIPRTPKTITQPERLLEELARAREKGYAVDDEENEPGIRCIAAPVYNHHQEPSFAISVSGPRDQIPLDAVEALARRVLEAAAELSRQLGHLADE